MFLMKLAVRFFTEREQLFPLEVDDRHSLPGAAGALKRRIHQFQDGAVATRMRDRVAAPACSAPMNEQCGQAAFRCVIQYNAPLRNLYVPSIVVGLQTMLPLVPVCTHYDVVMVPSPLFSPRGASSNGGHQHYNQGSLEPNGRYVRWSESTR